MSSVNKAVVAVVVVLFIGVVLSVHNRDQHYHPRSTIPDDGIVPIGAAVAASGESGGATVGRQIDDSVITAKIKSALVADRNVKGFDISVETRKGEVVLSGFVDNQAQVDRAATIARRVEGVRKVDNKLNVKR